MLGIYSSARYFLVSTIELLPIAALQVRCWTAREIPLHTQHLSEPLVLPILINRKAALQVVIGSYPPGLKAATAEG